MQLISALYGAEMPKHNANPKMRPHKLDNIEMALKMVDAAAIKTNFLKVSQPTQTRSHADWAVAVATPMTMAAASLHAEEHARPAR